MKSLTKILAALVAGGCITSCAEQDIVEFVNPVMPDNVAEYAYLKDYKNIKDYVEASSNPNLKVSCATSPYVYNLRGVAYRAANYNFNEIAPTDSMYYGDFVNDEGVIDVSKVGDMLGYGAEHGVSFYGGALSSNKRVNSKYLNSLIADKDVVITPEMREEVYRIDFADYSEFPFPYLANFKPTISSEGYLTANAVKPMSKFYLIQEFPTVVGQEYEVTMFARSTPQNTIPFKWADDKTSMVQKTVGAEWMEVSYKFTATSAKSMVLVDFGPLRNIVLDVMWVSIGIYPPDHVAQTPEEKKENVTAEVVRYTDAMMSTCAGGIKTWELLSNVISSQNDYNGYYDLRSVAESDFCWQEYLGKEDYASVVAKAAREAFAAYEGNPAELQFFVNEDNLNDPTDNYKRLRSLLYWIGVWDGKGAGINGISTTLHLTYNEDTDALQAEVASVVEMLKQLGTSGKQVRLAFDIKFVDIAGINLSTDEMDLKQKQAVASLYQFVIGKYLQLIPTDKQYGICQASMVDDSSNSGLWDASWNRKPAYAGYCDVLQGNLPTGDTFK